MSEVYRDRELSALMKDVRAAVKGTQAELPFKRAETRLKFTLRVVDSWDGFHAEQAEKLIRLGRFEEANSRATMIFDYGLRGDLYRRAPILTDTNAGDRVAEALELERLVLE